MWWVNISGNVHGPYSFEQLKKRVKLNMLRSLDRVSEDAMTWSYVKDTVLWNSVRAVKFPAQRALPSKEAQAKVAGPGMAQPVGNIGSDSVSDRFYMNPGSCQPRGNIGSLALVFSFE